MNVRAILQGTCMCPTPNKIFIAHTVASKANVNNMKNVLYYSYIKGLVYKAVISYRRLFLSEYFLPSIAIHVSI